MSERLSLPYLNESERLYQELEAQGVNTRLNYGTDNIDVVKTIYYRITGKRYNSNESDPIWNALALSYIVGRHNGRTVEE